ncbi:phosphatase PAP2 family protein [Cellulomonas sp. CW35]|uniref:phosphatase PAP2 family protein n=1 Tax=Cellulomonas sp. CW35 TaxID=3458249 RepID=UPI004034DE42
MAIRRGHVVLQGASPLAPAPSVHTPSVWKELSLLVALYVGYTASRQLASDNRASAIRHAMDIVDLQRVLHLNVELACNQALAAVPVLAVIAAYWYALLHYLITPVVLFAVARRRPQDYRRLRNALVLATIAALICYLAYPVAPPRFMPGYVDTLRETARWGWWSAQASAPRGFGQLSNQLAAMPSMHVGWAVWCALALRRLVPGRRGLWVHAYPVLTTVVVVVTANHWLLDAVCGAVLVYAAVSVTRLRRNRRTRGHDLSARKPPGTVNGNDLQRSQAHTTWKPALSRPIRARPMPAKNSSTLGLTEGSETTFDMGATLLTLGRRPGTLPACLSDAVRHVGPPHRPLVWG